MSMKDPIDLNGYSELQQEHSQMQSEYDKLLRKSKGKNIFISLLIVTLLFLACVCVSFRRNQLNVAAERDRLSSENTTALRLITDKEKTIESCNQRILELNDNIKKLSDSNADLKVQLSAEISEKRKVLIPSPQSTKAVSRAKARELCRES